MGKLNYGSTGISYQPDKVELKVGGAPKCPRCQDRVYFNEEKKALGKSWHNRCFTCASCKKRLDSNNCSGHDNEIYCMRCHRKEFGPKGYGFAGGMAGLSTESTYNNVRPVSPLHAHTVAEHIPSKTITKDDPSCCPRCGKRVFFAEELKAMGRKYHKLCFKCGSCNKILEPGSCNEHESQVYCKACYVRDFGPSGYGVAGLSSELRDGSQYIRGNSMGNGQRASGEIQTNGYSDRMTHNGYDHSDSDSEQTNDFMDALFGKTNGYAHANGFSSEPSRQTNSYVYTNEPSRHSQPHSYAQAKEPMSHSQTTSYAHAKEPVGHSQPTSYAHKEPMGHSQPTSYAHANGYGQTNGYGRVNDYQQTNGYSYREHPHTATTMDMRSSTAGTSHEWTEGVAI